MGSYVRIIFGLVLLVVVLGEVSSGCPPPNWVKSGPKCRDDYDCRKGRCCPNYLGTKSCVYTVSTSTQNKILRYQHKREQISFEDKKGLGKVSGGCPPPNWIKGGPKCRDDYDCRKGRCCPNYLGTKSCVYTVSKSLQNKSLRYQHRRGPIQGEVSKGCPPPNWVKGGPKCRDDYDCRKGRCCPNYLGTKSCVYTVRASTQNKTLDYQPKNETLRINKAIADAGEEAAAAISVVRV